MSSPLVNVLWGFLNFFAALGMILLWRPLDTASMADLGAAALGAVAMGVFMALHFGRVRGNR